MGEAIERYVHHDALRGLVMTDAKIGVFTYPHDPSLIQNRCFLYHIIGGATGEWRVPLGGMRSLVNGLIDRAKAQNVQLAPNAVVSKIHADDNERSVTFSIDDHEQSIGASHILVNAGPRTFAKLTGTNWNPVATDEGTAVKVNILLHRIPKLKAEGIDPHDAFCGSFHIDEGYEQMKTSYEQAANGSLPDPAPGEVYCHTLTDPSILSPELQKSGYQTLTLFGLDMAHRLFLENHDERIARVQNRYIAGLDRLCAEPFMDCVAKDSSGNPCIEIKSPVDLERELDLDLGNIFHNSLSWFYAEDEQDVGTWGGETKLPGVLLAGSSAHRGGAVSGIPGRNAAMCVLKR
ncbi:MAG: hypothetical protein R3C03_19830 [Pirellulaceae bacterium]